jgi:hypothetical protein
MNPQLTFVTRLRRERLRNGIHSTTLRLPNRIKVELLEAFENNDLTDWPRGLYARAWVRAYATAVGAGSDGHGGRVLPPLPAWRSPGALDDPGDRQHDRHTFRVSG